MSGNPGLRTRSWAFYPEPEFKLKIRSPELSFEFRTRDGAVAIWDVAPGHFLDAKGFAK